MSRDLSNSLSLYRRRPTPAGPGRRGSPLRPDLVLHGPLLVSGRFCKGPVSEPVVGAAVLEELGGADPVSRTRQPTPSRCRTTLVGTPPTNSKDVPEATAHALRVLAGNTWAGPTLEWGSSRRRRASRLICASTNAAWPGVDLRDPRGPVEVEGSSQAAPGRKASLPPSHVAPDGLLGTSAPHSSTGRRQTRCAVSYLLPVLPEVVREPLVTSGAHLSIFEGILFPSPWVAR